jgi:hypothetical protein
LAVARHRAIALARRTTSFNDRVADKSDPKPAQVDGRASELKTESNGGAVGASPPPRDLLARLDAALRAGSQKRK